MPGSESDVSLPSVTHDFEATDIDDFEDTLPSCATSESDSDFDVDELVGCCASFCLMNIPLGQTTNEKTGWQTMPSERQNLQVFNYMLANTDTYKKAFTVCGVELCPSCFRLLCGISTNRYDRLQSAVQHCCQKPPGDN